MGWDWFTDPDYWASRLAFQRMLAAIYLIAFLVALNQFRALIGTRGLLPVPQLVARVPFRLAPSVFHFHYSDRFFAAVAWTGALVTAALVFGVADSAPVWVSLVVWAVPWVLYQSMVNVGRIWYSFGWESLLLEAGFLAIFLGPAGMAPPVPVLWLLLWLLFRVEFGAGMIKMRGDRCWRDLTCLYYHHETQPMPGPLSWYFHHLPKPLHKLEALASHFTQLVVPFALFAPQPASGIAAAVMIVTQLWLVASGNFSWLNVLTITIAVSALDSKLLPFSPPPLAEPPLWYRVVVLAVTALVLGLSYRPARNLVSRGQIMNFSFDRLHLVNTYGAFGSISTVRHELVFEGTDEPDLTPATVWREYEFKGKPGDPRRRPRQVAPYHLRLDWMLWFVPLSFRYGESWLERLAGKLLVADRAMLKLLRHDPFRGERPTFVRARLFRYRFTTPAERRETGDWWVRRPLESALDPRRLNAEGVPVAAE
ncbi:lipase maturation factor family protein [Amycolatopsis alkalitolerans]|uniref:Lipase maturation factor family protein n=1 Tax=Amycolatopsis alkalitolerans TaxID=2547244 RepID=A0A5C4LYJ2_9PSEU|nr:lipase maturation factor family protein [Amycolatopsis alkalitolerans]TNC23976.1 lipase maturation factor family protein [Amycolatopsis alkalitolerans]